MSGKLYAKNITDYDVCIILPTGWSQTIKTIRLTGKQIQALYEEGYDAVGTGKNYPYMLEISGGEGCRRQRVTGT